MTNFCISLTSIPSRFSNLKKTIKSLQKQLLIPNKIYLNIPYQYKRFPNVDVDLSILNEFRNDIEIKRCEDFGPGTKLLGSLNDLKKHQYVIILDDDHVYNKYLTKIFIENIDPKIKSSYSFHVYGLDDLFIGQGADGFLINTKDITNIEKFYNKYVKKNNFLYFHDDLWISVFLNKILKNQIISLEEYLPRNIFGKRKPIYKKHTKIESLVNTYSKISKEGRSIRSNQSKIEYEKLIKSTKNFSKIDF